MDSEFFSILNFNLSDPQVKNMFTRQGPFEVRLNPKMYTVKVSLPDMNDSSLSEGSNTLHDYLNGNNFKVSAIKYGQRFIVTKSNSIELGYVLFEDNYPKPINRLIKFEEIPLSKIGVLKFKGVLTADRIERRCQELKKWLNFKQLKSSGPSRVFSDDFIVPALRSNEIHLDLI